MKRINFWRIVLALAFMTLFTGISSSEAAYKYTVTFTPDTGEGAANWTQAYCYVWANDGANQLSSWPGSAMTKSGSSWTITFSTDWQPDHLIFDKGSNEEQTADLSFTLNTELSAYKQNDESTIYGKYTIVRNVNSVSLSQTSADMTVGDTLTLTAIVSPDEASNKTVTWSTSSEDIASVDQTGKVTARGIGTAAITATADGESASCAITVKKAYTNTYIISIPDTLAINNIGWNDIGTVKASTDTDFDPAKSLKVTVSSVNNYVLSSDTTTDTISYELKMSSSASEKNANAVWKFSAGELETSGGTGKTIGVDVEDYSNKSGGYYGDTLTFSVSVE